MNGGQSPSAFLARPSANGYRDARTPRTSVRQRTLADLPAIGPGLGCGQAIHARDHLMRNEGDEHDRDTADRRPCGLAGTDGSASGAGEGAHPGGRRDRRCSPAVTDGRGRRGDTGGRRRRRDPAHRHLPGPITAVRVLPHVVHGPPREQWEDSPKGWPQPFPAGWDGGGAQFRIDEGGSPVPSPEGRPIPQWSRLDAGRSDDLGTGPAIATGDQHRR